MVTRPALPAPEQNLQHGLIEDLYTLLGVVTRGWRYIAVSVLICLTLASIYLAKAKRIYQASTRILILQNGGRPINVVSNDQVRSLEGSEDIIPTHMSLIKSPLVIQKAIQQLDMREVPSLAGEPNPMYKVIENTRIGRPDRQAKIITVDYYAASPAEAVTVLTAINESYQRFLESTYQKSNQDVISLIKKAQDELKLELDELNKQYYEFRQKNPVLTADEKGQPFILRRLDQWDQATNNAKLTTIRLKAHLDLAQRLAASGTDLKTFSQALGLTDTTGNVGMIASLSGQSAGSIDQLRHQLETVELQRRTQQGVVDKLRTKFGDTRKLQSVTDDMIWGVFISDAAVSDLVRKRSSLENNLAMSRRVTRNPRDPSILHSEEQLDKVKKQIGLLWEQRQPLLKKQLEREMSDERDLAFQKAETELVTLEAQEKSLRETLDEIEQGRVGELRQRERKMAAERPETDPELKKLRDQIALAEKHSDDNKSTPAQGEVQSMISSIEESLRSMEATIAEYDKRFEEDLAAAKKTELERLTEQSLRGNLARKEALYNSVVEQLKQAHFVSDFSSISAQTIDPPTALMFPVFPSIRTTLGIACLAGLVLGTVFAAIADRLDQRVHTISEVRRLLDYTVLGVIPRLSHEQSKAMGEIELISFSNSRSLLAESYRSIRTNIEFIRRNESVQVMLVTSPHSGDGKTTTASNLAISLAQAGRRVLLIDADLRRPSQHLLYGLSTDKGLVHVLKGLLPINTVIQNTSVENLDLIAAGPTVDNPSELLASTALVDFVEQVRKLYEVVIFDSSPLLAVTDPSIISSLVDGIVLVLRPRGIRRNEGERIAEMLRVVRTPVLGIVFNGLQREDEGFGYGYGYGYGNGYGYGYGYGGYRDAKQLNAGLSTETNPTNGI